MESTSHFNQWKQRCLNELDDKSCGINPTYHDDFELIKQELEKLKGCNYALIIDKSLDLLEKTSKDIRIASYLCLALTVKHKLDGFLLGMEILTELINQYAEELYPKSPNAKLSVLSWLNNPRFIPLLSNLPLDKPTHILLLQAIKRLNDGIDEQLGKDYPSFYVLDDWLNSLSITDEPKKNDHNRAVAQQKANNQPSFLAGSIIDNDKQAHLTQLQLIHYWLKEKKWFKACRLARTLRWCEISIAANKKNKTAISSPRKEAIKSMQVSINSSIKPEVMFEQCERFFLEPGGHLYLDIQYHAYHAAVQMQDVTLANYIKEETQRLIATNPDIPELKFTNGTPFMSSKTKQWLRKDKDLNPSPIEIEESVPMLLSQAECEGSNNLKKILQALNQVSSTSPILELRIIQAKAHACIKHKRYDLAFIFYEELLERSEDYQLLKWKPDETQSIWQETLLFMRNKGHYCCSNDSLKQKEQLLKKKLCQAGCYPASIA